MVTGNITYGPKMLGMQDGGTQKWNYAGRSRNEMSGLQYSRTLVVSGLQNAANLRENWNAPRHGHEISVKE
jgi:hypothetical protein